MRFVGCALVLVACAFSTSARSEGLATLEDLRRVTDQAMAKVGSGEVEAGLRLVKPHVVFPEAEFEAMVGQMKLQLPVASQRFGSSIGFEFIREDRVGHSLVKYTYVQKFERHAMRWMFIGYKAKGEWVVNTFRFDDQVPALFP